DAAGGRPLAIDRRAEPHRPRSARGGARVGPEPPTRRPHRRRHPTPRAPDPHVPGERARPTSSPRARARPPRRATQLVIPGPMSFRRIALLLLLFAPAPAAAQPLLVPMDDDQTNHLKAYGLMYNALKDGARGEWLLNYRGGSFLLPDTPEIRRRAGLDPERDGRREHGVRTAREGTQDRGVHRTVHAAVGRRGDPRAPLRR